MCSREGETDEGEMKVKAEDNSRSLVGIIVSCACSLLCTRAVFQEDSEVQEDRFI